MRIPQLVQQQEDQVTQLPRDTVTTPRQELWTPHRLVLAKQATRLRPPSRRLERPRLQAPDTLSTAIISIRKHMTMSQSRSATTFKICTLVLDNRRTTAKDTMVWRLETKDMTAPTSITTKGREQAKAVAQVEAVVLLRDPEVPIKKLWMKIKATVETDAETQGQEGTATTDRPAL